MRGAPQAVSERAVIIENAAEVSHVDGYVDGTLAIGSYMPQGLGDWGRYDYGGQRIFAADRGRPVIEALR